MLQFICVYFDFIIYAEDCYYMTMYIDSHRIPVVQQTRQFSLKLWM